MCHLEKEHRAVRSRHASSWELEEELYSPEKEWVKKNNEGVGQKDNEEVGQKDNEEVGQKDSEKVGQKHNEEEEHTEKDNTV